MIIEDKNEKQTWEDEKTGNKTVYSRHGAFDAVMARYDRQKDSWEYCNSKDDSKLYQVLNDCYEAKKRIRVWYGNRYEGRAWAEEYDVTGTVGRSCGGYFNIPLLINNRRSWGGSALLVACILRIDDTATHRTLYSVENFTVGKFSIDGKEVYLDGALCRRFDTEKQANRWVDFMTGKRYSK